jgi:hypothetical protein
MGTKCAIFIEDLPRMLPTVPSFDSFGKTPSDFREEDLLTSMATTGNSCF